MKVRWKLVAILLVPLAALGLLGFVGVRDRQDTADQAQRITAAVEVAKRASVLADALEREAIASASYVGSGTAELVSAVESARAVTDSAAAAFMSVDPSQVDPTRWGQATRTVDSIEVLRGAVDDGVDPTLISVTTYFQAVSKIRSTAVSSAGDPAVVTALRSYVAIGSAKQLVGHQLALLSAAGHGLELQLPHLVTLRTTAADSVVQTEVFNSLAAAEHKQLLRRVVGGPGAAVLDDVATAVAAGDSATLTSLGVGRLDDALTALDGYRQVERTIEGEVTALAAAQADSARADARSFLFLVLAIAGFALLSASIMGRAISGPLNRLTKAARRVADEQLPALVETLRSPTPSAVPELSPVIDKAGRDEIGELARAFEAIQRTAIDVAVEQAGLLRKGIGELFVNLARRNQSLLDRQIGFLDELEAAETDPDALEQLFKLDHLATRMRRNAESLLVLAGIDTPRRWSKPVTLVDVTRAAIGEVEQFSRVELTRLPDVLVHGQMAADIAHVLAELLDNATQFSAPSTVVTVTARVVPGGVSLEIADEGIGMSDEQLAEANSVLCEPPLNGLSLSRSLGFIVVGRLAERHGAKVHLVASPLGAGVVATVELPEVVLVAAVAAPAAPSLPRPESAPSPAADRAPEAPTVTTTVPERPVASESEPDHTRSVGRPDDVPVDLWARLVGRASVHWDDDDVTRPAPEWPPTTRPAAEVPGASEPIPRLADAVGEPGQLFAEITNHLTLTTEPDGWASAPQHGNDRPEQWSGERGVWADHAFGASPDASDAAAPLAALWPDLSQPASEAPLSGPATTAGGLPRRRATRHSSVTAASASSSPDGDGAVASQRSPAEIRSLLSNYRSGLARGRTLPSVGHPDMSESDDLSSPSESHGVWK